MIGRKKTKTTRKKKIIKKKKKLPKKRPPIRKKTRAQKARAMLKKMPKENTLPERITKRLLDRLDQEFVSQFPMSGYVYDFYIPSQNLLIEVNGDYFHSNPLKYASSKRSAMQSKNFRRDKRKMKVANNLGKRIIYIWESDLKNRVNKVLEELRDALQGEFKSRHLLEDIFPEYKKFYL